MGKWKPTPPASGMNKFERRQNKMADDKKSYLFPAPPSMAGDMEIAMEKMVRSMSARKLGDMVFAENASVIDKQAGPSAPREVKQFVHKVEHSVHWDQVIGNDLAKAELREAVEAMTTNRDLYDFYQMVPPKGVMLYGPPGCGKTMFGKATTTALGGKEFILINGPELQRQYVGQTEEIIRKIFAYAGRLPQAPRQAARHLYRRG